MKVFFFHADEDIFCWIIFLKKLLLKGGLHKLICTWDLDPKCAWQKWEIRTFRFMKFMLNDYIRPLYLYFRYNQPYQFTHLIKDIIARKKKVGFYTNVPDSSCFIRTSFLRRPSAIANLALAWGGTEWTKFNESVTMLVSEWMTQCLQEMLPHLKINRNSIDWPTCREKGRSEN